MGEHTSKQAVAREKGRSTLGELIHTAVREAIEAAVEAELAATLGAGRYERRDTRQGYRNGTKTRTLSGPTGAMALSLSRATVATRTETTGIILNAVMLCVHSATGSARRRWMGGWAKVKSR